MRKGSQFTVLAASIAALLSGCASKTPRQDIPIYPNGQGIQARGMVKTATVIAYNNRWVTPSGASLVVDFYAKALLSRAGWTQEGDPQERVIFTDGNMKPTEDDSYWQIDETKPGGAVVILAGGDRTLITISQAFPLPK